MNYKEARKLYFGDYVQFEHEVIGLHKMFVDQPTEIVTLGKRIKDLWSIFDRTPLTRRDLFVISTNKLIRNQLAHSHKGKHVRDTDITVMNDIFTVNYKLSEISA